MRRFLAQFVRDEDGAVTVDWVVLTAAVVGLAAAAYVNLEAATLSLSNVAANNVIAEQSK